jgi:hypothetical protein
MTFFVARRRNWLFTKVAEGWFKGFVEAVAEHSSAYFGERSINRGG